MIDMTKELPETLTTDVFLLYNSKYGYTSIARLDLSNMEEYVLLGTSSATFKLDKIDVKSEIVKGLEAEKKEIQAATHMKLKKVQDKIDNLLAIEYIGDDK